jgi:hypothetical protein
MTARKAIKRSTKESARRAMTAHIAKMKSKGWTLDNEFEGDAGAMWECVAYFSK